MEDHEYLIPIPKDIEPLAENVNKEQLEAFLQRDFNKTMMEALEKDFWKRMATGEII